MNKNLLITGGSGYLGAHLVRAALAQGWKVYTTYYSHLVEPGRAVAVPLDLRDADKAAHVIRNIHPRAILHTACSNRGGQVGSIVAAAATLARVASDAPCRLVHVSSDMVFDGEHAPYDDEAAPQPVLAYGRAKAEAEALLRERCPAAAIVRPSLIWGLDPIDHQTRWLVDGIKRREPVTLFIDEYRCPVYVHDLCAALLELANQPDITGAMNLGGAQPLTRWDFGVKLLDALRLAAVPYLRQGTAREAGLERPRNLTLASTRAARLLKTRLRGVDDVLTDLHLPC